MLARLMNVKITLPGFGSVDNVLAFPVASIFVIVAVVLLFIFVKEKNSKVRNDDKQKEEKKEPILKSLKVVLGEKNKYRVLITLLSSWAIYDIIFHVVKML